MSPFKVDFFLLGSIIKIVWLQHPFPPANHAAELVKPLLARDKKVQILHLFFYPICSMYLNHVEYIVYAIYSYLS